MRRYESFCLAQEKVNPTSHEDNMMLAIDAAMRAKSNGDMPIGAAIIWPNRHLSEHSTTVTEHNPLGTAELNVLRKASDMMPHKLKHGILYTTLEPDIVAVLTAMKAGINEIVFGAYDLKNGFTSSKTRKLDLDSYDIAYKDGILAERCLELLPKNMHSFGGFYLRCRIVMFDIYTLTQEQLRSLLCEAFMSGHEGCYDLMDSEAYRISDSVKQFRTPKKLKQRYLPIRSKSCGTEDPDTVVRTEGLLIRCPSCERSDLELIRQKDDNGVFEKVYCHECGWQASALAAMAEKLLRLNDQDG